MLTSALRRTPSVPSQSTTLDEDPPEIVGERDIEVLDAIAEVEAVYELTFVAAVDAFGVAIEAA